MKKRNILFGSILVIFSIYFLLNTFVISDVKMVVDNDSVSVNDNVTGDIDVDDNSYSDEHISINIKTIDKYDTKIYIADIVVDDISYLKSAFANNSYGKNVVDKTSNIASDNNCF